MQKQSYSSPAVEEITLMTGLGICQMSGQIEELDPTPGPFSAPSIGGPIL